MLLYFPFISQPRFGGNITIAVGGITLWFGAYLSYLALEELEKIKFKGKSEKPSKFSTTGP